MKILKPIISSGDTYERVSDVIVVGLGGAGLSSAIAARRSGADVLGLERASGAGGSTALAGGYIYLGGGTPLQRATGHDDTPEAMYDYLVAATPAPDHAKIRAYCEDSIAHFEWLAEQGIPFNETIYGEKHFEHPTQDGLAWTGNEKTWPFDRIATPMPRGHRAAAPPGTGGNAVVEHLLASALDAGVEIRTDHAVQALLIDDEGRVCGVEARNFGETRRYAARKGVILTTGGFGMNAELLARHCPDLTREGIEIIGSPNSDGAGLELGLSAGGQIAMPRAYHSTSPIYPPASLLEGILINRDGRRFVGEDSYHGRTTAAILRQPEARAWLICDCESFDRPLMGQQLVDAWDDFSLMERDLGLEENSLTATVERYNALAAAGEDGDFHKAAQWLRPIDKPPYAAIDCSLGSANFPGFTLGGLKTDIDGRVLGEGDRPIGGLFAAGQTACNIAAAMGAENYVSGVCIGESTYFGRRAGRAAALSSGERAVAQEGNEALQ